MKTVLQQAIEVAQAAVRGLSLSVNSKDPITGAVSIMNNTLTPGASEMVGFLLGIYKADDNSFSFLTFNDGVADYVIGSFLTDTMPAQGSSKNTSLPSYAFPVSQSMTLDAFIFVMPPQSNPTIYGVDYGSGRRAIAWNWAEFKAAVSTIIASKVFTAVITINPPVAPIEITGFMINKL